MARPELPPGICLLTETYYPLMGGGETQARTLAETLAASGVDVFVMTRRVSRELPNTEVVDGIPIHRVRPVGAGPLRRWGMLFWTLVALGRLRSRYGIVYVSGFKALGISAVLMSKLLGKVCILKADSNGEMSGEFFAGGLKAIGLTPSSPPVRAFLWVRNKILRRADLFVAITPGIAAELTSHGVNPEAIHPVTNCVDTRRFRPVDNVQRRKLRETLDLPRKEIIVIYSGRLVSYKGLPLLIRVADRVQGERADVGFVFVGSGGIDIHNCEAELRDYARANDLEHAVRFTGAVENVHEYLQASDIFVSPTEKDAFPLALVEAMACGLAVISTPVGGIQGIIEDRKNGLLVPPGDARLLYDAIRSVIEDPTLLASLGEAAVETVEREYSAGVVSAKYLELFRSASGLRRSHAPSRDH